MAQTKHLFVTVQENVKVFYREAGSSSAPVILLLHGFPSSSFQFRKLIPLLALQYRVLALDLPGFGLTECPTSYKYTFASIAETTEAFCEALSINHCAVYIFDYGAPTALRMALNGKVTFDAIISQNGNAYEEGFGQDFWAPIFAYWKTNGSAEREVLRTNALTLQLTKFQYESGVPEASQSLIAPEAYYYDFMLMQRPGNFEIQLDLFYDYRTNVTLYPKFQEYFRTSQVPVLAAWGKGDPIFIPPGAQAFKRDVPEAEIHFLDSGHFALETEVEKMSQLMLAFLARIKY